MTMCGWLVVCQLPCHNVLGAGQHLAGVVALEQRHHHVHVGHAGMDLGSARRDRLGVGHVRRQLFEVQLDLPGGLTGLVLGVCCDDRDHVAVPEHLLVGDDRAVDAVELGARMGEREHDAVGALDVLGRDDLDDARHGLGLGGVDALDVGVIEARLDDGEVQRTGRHLEPDVVAVVRDAADLGERVGSRHGRAVHAAVGADLEGDVLHGLLAAHDGRTFHDAVDQGLPAAAAAGVLVVGEPVAHLARVSGPGSRAAARRPRR